MFSFRVLIFFSLFLLIFPTKEVNCPYLISIASKKPQKMEKEKSSDLRRSSTAPRYDDVEDNMGVGEVINASGHVQELERQFSLLSICAIGISTGNVWAALGGSIVCHLSLANPQIPSFNGC